ncbi:cytochrome c [Oceanobacter sp. 5_MG-2023]|uniref:cytochrome c n=1 Tax=Oceanobacter sp. 5_MG-2023 TaxID=3062645 RepID=UPI0026E2E005|nr:cytochrome c [Oceanobacter sp. 5_MG-2023]MDO6682694.1 cytochrome c [Oceanobacter sp. 5_MG-2023]
MKHLIVLFLLAASAATYAEHPAVEQRQQLFEEIEEQTDYLEQSVDDEHWSEVETTALKLDQQVQRLLTLFPPESSGEGRSRKAVWRHWDAFERDMMSWQMAYRDIAAAAVAEVSNEDALDQITSACRSCHRKYRSLW